jgi:undecaprenyl diphosphate synthase
MSSAIPQHIAIIMDGNGRWAQARGLPRAMGHKQGAEAVERVVRAAAERGVKFLTLFAFSTENWNRPEEEVSGLMGLLKMYLHGKTAEMHKNNVRLNVIGDRSRLSEDILSLVENAEKLTQGNTGITVNMAVSYSGRWDIAQAVRKIALAVERGDLTPDRISEEAVSAYLSTAGMPDPDLVIRTSGEQRISNFLLWQGAYSEYHFTDTYWPDFDAVHLDTALDAYRKRERRFGNIRIQQNS